LDIPTKYSFSDEVKLLYEIPRFDGSIVKFYENFMIELKQKHNLVHKFYPDGSIISIFPNRDIRLVSNSADAFYKFRNVGINVFDYYENDYSLFKYRNGTIEKIFRNGMRIIKNPYSSEIIIITFNDKEYTRNQSGKFVLAKTKKFI